jgi:hypothetical protein
MCNPSDLVKKKDYNLPFTLKTTGDLAFDPGES